MKSIKELRNELNESKQEDIIEAKLSPDQRKRLDDLIGDVIDVTDPFYLGLGIPGNNVDLEKTLETIESEFGKEVRDSVENGIDIWHYGRENRADGDDPLDNIFHRRGKGRITKKGKLNKQDAESLKKSIKKNLKSSSLGIRKLKKAVKQNKSRFSESKQEDIADLKALLKNPDPKVAKNYGGIEGYKKMIQSKIDKLMKEGLELEEAKVNLRDLLKVVKTAKDDWKNIPGLDQEYDSFEDYLDNKKQAVRDFRKKNPSAKDRLDHLVKEETELEEAMSRAARIKRSKAMKRLQPKIKRAKERAAKKKASSNVIDKRAEKQAKEVLIKKWLKGKNKSDVPFAERERIEDKLKKSKKAVNRIKKKFVKVIRKQEADKLAKEESTELDENKHTIPDDYIDFMDDDKSWIAVKATNSGEDTVRGEIAKKNWPTGAPVTKTFAKGTAQIPDGEFWVIVAKKYWYWKQDNGKWAALPRKGATPPFDY